MEVSRKPKHALLTLDFKTYTFRAWFSPDQTSQVKRAKIDLLCSQYENFIMHDNDSIDDMVTRFTKITNGLTL